MKSKDMKSKDHPVLEEFEDHPNLGDKDLVDKLLNGPWFLGYEDEGFVPTREDEGFVPTREDEGFVPTRKELLVLFKHWYKVAQDLSNFLHLCYSRKDGLILDDILRRIHLISKFLPEEVLEAVCKEMDEEELKLREEEFPRIAKEWGGKGDEFDKYYKKEREERHQDASQERLF